MNTDTMNTEITDAAVDLEWLTRVVLPAIRKDGAYFPNEDKFVAGEITEEEFVRGATAWIKEKAARLVKERDQKQRTT